jgi:hypothetical protein
VLLENGSLELRGDTKLLLINGYNGQDGSLGVLAARAARRFATLMLLLVVCYGKMSDLEGRAYSRLSKEASTVQGVSPAVFLEMKAFSMASSQSSLRQEM